MHVWMFVAGLGLVGCGNDSDNPPSPDGPTGNRPNPRIIAGGGIGDGAIDGVANIYVIDERTRAPVSGANVQVGTVTGRTGTDGLFVAEGVVGSQDVTVDAGNRYRTEMWLGANGANMTVNVEEANPAVERANLSGTLQGFDALTPFPLPTNHAIVAIVGYSQTDDIGDPANELEQPIVDGIPQNMCFVLQSTDPCNFVVTSRTGKVALMATIIENDSKGTPEETDDVNVIIGYAIRRSVVVAANQNQIDQNLTLIAAGALQDVTVDYRLPPTGLTDRAAVIQMELGDEGVLPLGFTTETTLKVPRLSVVTGATGYRLIGIAGDGATTNARQSVVLRRGLAGPTLSADTWLSPPSGSNLGRLSAAWVPTSDATLHSLEFKQGATSALTVTVFDNTRDSVTILSPITLPSGPLEVSINAIGATGLDVTSFSIDADRDKLDRVAGQSKTIQ